MSFVDRQQNAPGLKGQGLVSLSDGQRAIAISHRQMDERRQANHELKRRPGIAPIKRGPTQ